MTSNKLQESDMQDDTIETLDNGAVQSKLPYLLANIPTEAMLSIGKVLYEGVQKYAKPGEDSTDANMRAIPVKSHLNHALVHIYNYLGGHTEEDDLAHALVRVMYAVTNNVNQLVNVYENLVGDNKNTDDIEEDEDTDPCFHCESYGTLKCSYCSPSV